MHDLPSGLQQLELDGLGHSADGLTRDEATAVIAGLREVERHDPSPDPPTARQRGYLRRLRRQLTLPTAPMPATRGAASLEIARLRAQLARALQIQARLNDRAPAKTGARSAHAPTHLAKKKEASQG